MAERRFLDFLDMIDGGGAGQMGDRFEGGGLLSTLGNLVATPYGSEDERRAAARRDFYSSQDIGQPLNTTASMAAPAVAMAPRPNNSGMTPANAYVPTPPPNNSGMTPANAYVPTPVSVPNNSGMNPANAYVPPQQYSASGMNPANVYDGNQERFARQLVEMIGPDAAQNLMNSGMGEQAYQAFVANGYNMPNY